MSDTMPERVWLHGFDTYQGFSTANLGEHCYVPEQRALAAEHNFGVEHDEVRRLTAERDALQADLEALLPLVRYGAWAWEQAQSGGGLWEDDFEAKAFELGLSAGFGRATNTLAAAKAILDRETP